MTQETDDTATSYYFALMQAQGDVAGTLSEVNQWLRENSAHQIAWLRMQRTGRLVGPYLKATRPDASKEDIAAFFDAIKDERIRSPAEFGDA